MTDLPAGFAMFFDFATPNPPVQYRLLTSGIVPRPIAWVSTRSAEGVDNLAPYSFFTVASIQPPVLAVTQVNPPNRPADRPHKDTLTNLLATRECVVQVASASQLALLNASAGEYAPAQSEFDLAGVARAASTKVAVPGVADAPVRYECTLREILPIAPTPMGGTLMLLDVVGVHVHPSVLQQEAIDPALHHTLGKMGGDGYSLAKEDTVLARPVVKP